MHLGLFSAVKNLESLHLPRCCGLIHLEWWCDFTGTCRTDLPSYFLLGPSSYLVSCEKVHTFSPLCIYQHYQKQPEIWPQRLSFTPAWGFLGVWENFQCYYLMFVADSKCYLMFNRHNFYLDFNSFNYGVCYGSAVSPWSVGMWARKSLQGSRIPYHDVPGNYCVSAFAGAAVLSEERLFTGEDRTETFMYPV